MISTISQTLTTLQNNLKFLQELPPSPETTARIEETQATLSRIEAANTDEALEKAGAILAECFKAPRDPEDKTRWDLGGGTKTNTGAALTARRIILDGDFTL